MSPPSVTPTHYPTATISHSLHSRSGSLTPTHSPTYSPPSRSSVWTPSGSRAGTRRPDPTHTPSHPYCPYC